MGRYNQWNEQRLCNQKYPPCQESSRCSGQTGDQIESSIRYRAGFKKMLLNGCKEFNIKRGESEYKTKWTDASRISWRSGIRNNRTSSYGRVLLMPDKWGKSE
jgi:hypothetical protein